MNWLDFLILIVIAVTALMGLKTGLIGALFTVAAVLLGWFLAGRWADNVGSWFDKSLSNDTIITVAAYVIILITLVFVAKIIVRVVRPLLGMATLGLSSIVDRAGGLALGILIGIFLAGAVFMGLARLAYNFRVEELGDGIATMVADKIPEVDQIREGLETALMESTSAPIFVDVVTALPGSALGFAPDDFKVALEILDQRIMESKDAP